MADPVLATVSSPDFDTAESTLIALLRAAYPTLDLRRGTVLRDLLVRPAAAIYALNTNRLAELQTRMSLVNLAAQPAGTVPSAWVDAILANFGMTMQSGQVAAGSIRVVVDGSRTYTLAPSLTFKTLEGLSFSTGVTYTVKPDGTGDLLLLPTATGSAYYFILPVVADSAGAVSNLQAGTAVNPTSSIYGFISAETSTTFTGGVDAETIQTAITRIPAAVSYRALESRTSIEAKLRAQYDGSSTTIQALGVQGYGDRAQLRDKHNPMGFAVGSRVDLYPRTFTQPPVVTLQKTGTRVSNGVYSLSVSRTDAPGYYAVRSISEPEASIAPAQGFGTLPVIGSYSFTETRFADGIAGTFHDFDVNNAMIETCATVWQACTILVTGVPDTAAQHSFKVELYSTPGVTSIQQYVDSAAVRNVEADYVVRMPFCCMVGVQAVMYYPSTVAIDVPAIQQDIVDYINSRSFVQRLTRSELVCIMHAAGVQRVNMGNGGMVLQGTVRAADGVVRMLQGDALDLEQIAEPAALLTYDTTVFATEPGMVVLTALPEV